MPVTNYYVRATNGTDAPGGGGSHATAYQTIQYALDDIGATHGKGAAGDQVNICDEATNSPAAALSLAAYGVPATGAPLILRGYTSVANDGGRGSIDRTGGAVINDAALTHVHLVDLDLKGGSGGTAVVRLGNYCVAHNLDLTPSALNVANGLNLAEHSRITGNRLRYLAGVANFVYGLQLAATAFVMGNFLDGCIISGNDDVLFLGNIVRVRAANYNGIMSGFGHSIAVGNIVYNLTAGTVPGIYLGNWTARRNHMALNNIVCGFSGVGGKGIASYTGERVWMAGHNAYWNNTTNYYAGETYIDLTANDIALAADPFVDAPNGDFTLTKAAKAALSAKGFPLSYLGAHVNTVPNVTIGAMQMPNGGGGAVSISPHGRRL